MIKTAVFIFAGGAVGAILRELLMIVTPTMTHGFPLDILAANLVASLLLGFVTALHSRKLVSDSVNTLFGSGVAGGLSTFSSFAYGVTVLMAASSMSAIVAAVYVVISLMLGYLAVVFGLKIGRQQSP